MRPEQGFRERTRFEQREAQKHRVSHAAPDGAGDIPGRADGTNENRIDTHAHHNEKGLKRQGEQGTDIVLSGGAPITVRHCGKRNRSDGGRQIHLYHASVNDEHNTDGERVHRQPHEKGLEPQTEQFTGSHCFKLGLHIGYYGVHVKGGVSDDNAGGAVHHTLANVEDTHDDIPGVGYDQHGAEGLENPLEEHPGINVVHIILFCHKLDQLITHNESQDNPGYRDNDRL